LCLKLRVHSVAKGEKSLWIDPGSSNPPANPPNRKPFSLRPKQYLQEGSWRCKKAYCPSAGRRQRTPVFPPLDTFSQFPNLEPLARSGVSCDSCLPRHRRTRLEFYGMFHICLVPASKAVRRGERMSVDRAIQS